MTLYVINLSNIYILFFDPLQKYTFFKYISYLIGGI